MLLAQKSVSVLFNLVSLGRRSKTWWPSNSSSQLPDKCTSKHYVSPTSLWGRCEFVWMSVWDNGNPLMPKSDLVGSFVAHYFPFGLLERTLMRTQKRRPLLPALTVSIMELFWRLPPTSHLLLFQPHMQAAFHLSLLSSPIACNCWERQATAPPPLPLAAGGSCLSARVVSVTLSVHSHWYSRDEMMSVVFTQHIHNTHMIWFKGTHEWTDRSSSLCYSSGWHFATRYRFWN